MRKKPRSDSYAAAFTQLEGLVLEAIGGSLPMQKL